MLTSEAAAAEENATYSECPLGWVTAFSVDLGCLKFERTEMSWGEARSVDP